MSSKNYYIPRYLDEPERILIFTVDEFMAMIIPFIILGLLLKFIMTGLIVSAASIYLVRKFKSDMGGAVCKHWLYWHLPREALRLKATPSASIREYIG